ncbi:N-acetyl-alpha-D-glucosaminyl L-malate synthase BshA [Risungbinella massiliensis]|uniref:N-acetyl-alpha-D-glucosaminyl L-malate synthase BshA n=1 Tax=Risungbinella massiliensis TaxID=1329796 RepID=UPI0005CC1976|nr:N-acetyl-alpha-D-glucosaminyl L-malate synthase BshA [Risungbinella massiliensis]
MRIGITCYPSHGGSGVVATELGKLLAENGHEVHFITYEMPFRLGNFHQNIFYHEVEANQYALFKFPPYDLALASRMAQVAIDHKLDLLHVHYAVPHAVAAVLAKQMVGDHLKVVTTLHGTDITVLGEDPTLKGIIKFGLEKSDMVTAVSDSLIQQTYDMFHVKVPIERIYNFVDERVYYPRDVQSIRRQYVSDEEKILLHISNFRPVKRPKDVVDIFHRVQEKVPSHLLLVGEGPELMNIHQQVIDLGIQDRVHFLGKQNEVAQLISLADLLLLPSEKESFGLVALEAMACGVPTVGSATGGVPELVKQGETGYLANVGDVPAMAESAIDILSHPHLHEKMVSNGLERASKHFSGSAITKQYEALYQRLLQQD